MAYRRDQQLPENYSNYWFEQAAGPDILSMDSLNSQLLSSDTTPRSPLDQSGVDPTSNASFEQKISELQLLSGTDRWRDGDPWHPLAAPDASQTVGPVPQFTTYRGLPLKSDDASSVVTGPPDSGYVTNRAATYSVGSAAEPVATGQDCKDLVDPLVNFHPYTRRSRGSTHLDVPNSSQRSDTQSPTRSVAQSHACTQCGAVYRLQSELKKHVLKHERPFKCDQPNCNKAEVGFPTVNDLERHQKSKHKIFPRAQNKVYKCAAARCAGKAKVWPRLDNFRAHVKRIHEDENEAELVRRSECTAGSADVVNATPGVLAADGSFDAVRVSFSDAPDEREMDWPGFSPTGTSALGEYADFAGLSQDWEGRHDDFSRQPDFTQTQPNTNPLLNYPPSTSRSVPVALSSSSGFTQKPIVHNTHEERVRNLELADLSSDMAAHFKERDPEVPLENFIYQYFEERCRWGTALSISTNSSPVDPRRLGGFVPRGRANGATSFAVDSVSPQMLQGEVSSPQSSSSDHFRTFSTSAPHDSRFFWSDPGLQCHVCDKWLPRQCDLKKHMRRHTRPFACTYDGCYKTFGSKNDWKRHENSQHFQENSWRCEIPVFARDSTGRQPPCAQLFHNKKEFARHMKGKHQIDDEKRWEDECRRRRIGVNGQRSFWCGFCQGIQQLQGQGTKAWDDRFNHIAHHFTKEKRKIQDWLPPKGNKTKGTLEKLQNGRNKPADDDDDDDDDDDGSEPQYDGIGFLNAQQAQAVATPALFNATFTAAAVPRTTQKRKKDDQNDYHFYCCQCGFGPYSIYSYKDGQCGVYDASCQHAFCDTCYRNSKRGRPSQ